MQIIVRSDASRVVQVSEDSTVMQLIQQVSTLEAVPLAAMYLTCGGRVLDENLALTAAGVSEMVTVEVAIRMLGGKVHGSLARAGKVKGQTPKIEKKEKKKQKTGELWCVEHLITIYL